MCKEAGRPWPVIYDDDVMDFMVMEAIALKVNQQDERQRKDAQREQWKRETANKLKQL